jgi:hypothetical protein
MPSLTLLNHLLMLVDLIPRKTRLLSRVKQSDRAKLREHKAEIGHRELNSRYNTLSHII